MNIMNLAIIGIWVIFIVAGIYKGFLRSSIGIGIFVLSLGLAWLLYPLLARTLVNNTNIVSQLLYYTQSSDMLGGINMAKRSVSFVSMEEAQRLTAGMALPFPLTKLLLVNMQSLAFADHGIYTFGDYINYTSVYMSINIIALLGVFLSLYILLEFLCLMLDKMLIFPKLKMFDGLMGGLIGVLKGGLVIYVLFMAVCIVLTCVPLDFVTAMINESGLAAFFYKSNVLLSWIPGIV